MSHPFGFDEVVESPIYCVAAVFRHSAYYMYCLVPEKTLRLVYETFYNSMSNAFYETANFNEFVNSRNYIERP
ncbi:MAG: hypothetical protein KJN80_09925 [Deltaproteobacteria bacterium]|nr:hypothetical protein [Deltaproteobacteria bacterium]